VDGAVVLSNGVFDLADDVVPALAAPALPAAGKADAAEVLILAAVAPVFALEQPSAALGAVERPPEVVLVLVRSITGYRAGREQRLHMIEGVPVD
jgi:hypothetical protein